MAMQAGLPMSLVPSDMPIGARRGKTGSADRPEHLQCRSAQSREHLKAIGVRSQDSRKWRQPGLQPRGAALEIANKACRTAGQALNGE